MSIGGSIQISVKDVRQGFFEYGDYQALLVDAPVLPSGLCHVRICGVVDF